MRLPMHEEIREARRLATDGTDAVNQLRVVEMLLSTVRVLEAQALRDPDLQPPGDADIDALSARWPALADLRAAGPRPAHDAAGRVAARRTQLEAARAFLKALANDAHARQERMYGLLHEQHHMLDDPAWAEVVFEMGSVSVERDRVAAELQPLQERAQTFAPLIDVLASFHARVADEIAGLDPDPTGHKTWRVAVLARGVVAGLGSIPGVPLVFPPQGEMPEAPAPEHRVALRAEIEGISDALRKNEAALRSEVALLQAEAVLLADRIAALDARLAEYTG